MCVRATSMGSHPLAEGQGRRVGSPVQRSSPTLPRQTYLHACPWILARIAWGAPSHCLIFVLCGTARARPTPLRIIFILFCRHAIPGVWRALGTKLSFALIAQSVRMMVCHLSVSSDQDKSTCVCVNISLRVGTPFTAEARLLLSVSWSCRGNRQPLFCKCRHGGGVVSLTHALSQPDKSCGRVRMCHHNLPQPKHRRLTRSPRPRQQQRQGPQGSWLPRQLHRQRRRRSPRHQPRAPCPLPTGPYLRRLMQQDIEGLCLLGVNYIIVDTLTTIQRSSHPSPVRIQETAGAKAPNAASAATKAPAPSTVLTCPEGTC